MTIREIVSYPDPRLQNIAAPVVSFDENIHTLAADLLDTMRAAPGIGITASHIGVLLQMVVLELPEKEAHTYINPTITWASDEMIHHQEGSISMPGIVENIERHARIRIRYQDLSGNEHFEESEGLLAVCHQHEIDQLNGVFWLQRLSRLKRERLIKKFAKFQL